MPRASATFSVSLPPEMAQEIDRARKTEHRTRSEFVREALRQYMDRGAVLRDMGQRIADMTEAEPTPEEIDAINEGLRELRQGKSTPLSTLRHDLDYRPRKSRGKKPQARTRR